MTLNWLHELDRLGVEITALAMHEDATVRAAAGNRLCVIPARTRFLRTALWHFDLLRRVARCGVEHDVLVVPSGYPCVLGSHPRLVLFVHDLSALDAAHYRFGKRLWFKAFWPRSLGKARLLVCVSEHTRRTLLARRPGLDPGRVVVVHNALPADLEQRLSSAGTTQSSRRPHLLFVGTIEARKNLPRLLDAYALAARTGTVQPLVLAGRRGHGSDAILARANAEDLRSLVTYREAPSESELVALYASARALLFPSLDEGFGLPILEAMAAGAAVLTSDRAAMPEIAGAAALIVNPTEVAAISAEIVRLCGKPGLCDDLAERGRARVREFSSHTLARVLWKHLQAIA